MNIGFILKVGTHLVFVLDGMREDLLTSKKGLPTNQERGTSSLAF